MKEKHINILKSGSRRQVQIQSNYDFFNEEVIVNVGDGIIIFTKPDIDYNGKTHKPNAIKSGWYTFLIVAEIPSIKNLKFDEEESTEDELIVYF